MNLIKIYEDGDFVIDYDKKNKRYRVSVFEDCHFKDECWINACEPNKEVAVPIGRYEHFEVGENGYGWWHGYCPSCKERLSFNYQHDSTSGNRKNYCFNCGQLVDFEWDIDK